MEEEKFEGKSRNIVKDNIDNLKEIFPQIVTDGKIDFDMLKNILGEEVAESKERYGFQWHGKSDAIKLAQEESTGTLRPCKEESKNWDTTKNLYIEGDNLEVLKILQNSYKEKIKMIYIDPPYNTGNDFVYKDDYNDNIANYLEQTKQVDEEGRTSTNTESSGRFHTNWLNMMYPRLMLARDLLAKDGVIFISIDDNEAVNLKKICDEIFGANNFETIIYTKVRHENRILREDIRYQLVMEQILCYSKSKLYSPNRIPKKDDSEKEYKYDLNILNSPAKTIKINNYEIEVFSQEDYRIVESAEGKGLLKKYQIRGSLISQSGSASEFYEINLRKRKDSDGLGTLYKVNGMGIKGDGLGYRYIMQPEKASSKNGFYFQGRPIVKKKNLGLPYSNFLDIVKEANNVGYEGDIEFKNGKKPLDLLKKLLELSNITNSKDSIIMDFFSGSSSTAHAVMNLNCLDNGNRKYIMVQLPEDENNETYKQGFKNICEIGKERIRRAGDKILEESNKKDLDIGFKVFKLDSSNLIKWNNNPDSVENTLESFGKDIVVPGRTDYDLIYSYLLSAEFDLNASIEEINLSNHKVYSVNEGKIFFCFDKNITSGITQELIDLKNKCNTRPIVVFKDNAFNDVDKTNLRENLSSNGFTKFVTI